MGFTRVRRQESENYTIVCNKILREKNISLKAKGLFITVMGLPDSWDFSVSGVTAVVKESRDAVYAAIRELEAGGYCRREQSRNEDGTLSEMEYCFLESPEPKEPYTENPYKEKPTQYNKQRINYEKNKSPKKAESENKAGGDSETQEKESSPYQKIRTPEKTYLPATPREPTASDFGLPSTTHGRSLTPPPSYNPDPPKEEMEMWLSAVASACGAGKAEYLPKINQWRAAIKKALKAALPFEVFLKALEQEYGRPANQWGFISADGVLTIAYGMKGKVKKNGFVH